MNLLLDENMPAPIKNILQDNHCNVKIINSKLKGMCDDEVFILAQKEQRCIVTKDSDFDKYQKLNHYGIIRINGLLKNFDELLLKVLNSYKEETLKDIYIFIKKDCYEVTIKKYSKKGNFKQFSKIKKSFNK